MADAGKHRPGRASAVPGFHITTQDDLPGPDGDEPYLLATRTNMEMLTINKNSQ